MSSNGVSVLQKELGQLETETFEIHDYADNDDDMMTLAAEGGCCSTSSCSCCSSCCSCTSCSSSCG